MRKKQADRCIITSIVVIAFALGMGAKAIYKMISFRVLNRFFPLCMVVSVGLTATLITDFFVSNKIWKGFRYFWHCWGIKNRLERLMLDAGFGITPQNKAGF